MGPIWGRQDPGGPRVGPMNLAIWESNLDKVLCWDVWIQMQKTVYLLKQFYHVLFISYSGKMARVAVYYKSLEVTMVSESEEYDVCIVKLISK